MKSEILTAGALVVACSSFGAGFQVLEQGASNIGSAMAGAAANGSADASAAFWNPSAAFFSGLEEGEIRADASCAFVMPRISFKGGATKGGTAVSGDDGGNAGEVAYVPNFFSVYRFSENFIFSFASTATYGLETDYNGTWVGRYMAINSNLATIDANPSLAWRVNDWFSVSAGAAVNWIHANLTQAYNPMYMFSMPDGKVRFSGDDFAVGATAGFAIEYAEGGRFSASWRSEVSHHIEGNACVDYAPAMIYGMLTPIECHLTLPQTVNAGIYQRLWGDLDRFAVMFDYAWTGWSCFETLDIRKKSGGSFGDPVQENWKDTSRVSLGFHYYPDFDENLVFRFGTTWDESPVRDAEHRTARIPCSDRVWIAGGVGYTYENVSIQRQPDRPRPRRQRSDRHVFGRRPCSFYSARNKAVKLASLLAIKKALQA